MSTAPVGEREGNRTLTVSTVFGMGKADSGPAQKIFGISRRRVFPVSESFEITTAPGSVSEGILGLKIIEQGA